jgi:proteasome-associated ATPase
MRGLREGYHGLDGRALPERFEGMDDQDRLNDLDDFEFPETKLRASALVDEILTSAAPDDPRLLRRLLMLRHQIEVDEHQFEEAHQALAEYEEAYEKLTQPANRLATYLGIADDEGDVLISLGDTEFVAKVDPKMEETAFEVGTRVRVNEAYAVVGDMGPHPAGPIVKIADILDNDRVRVSTDAQGQSGRIIARGEALKDVDLKKGDEVRVEPGFRVALEHFSRQETDDFFLEHVPEIPWSAIGGQDEAIRLIRETIEGPMLHPEIYARFEKKPLKGILLFGPPGCGKTLIGKATAYNLTQEYNKQTGKDMKEYFMYINGPKILNMWLGETERMVREIFATAREKAASGHLVFIFIDEAESILRTRSSGRYLNIANTVVPQFAAEMDGLVSLDNVVVLLTSNRPDYIDPAILRPERIDRKVKINRPDKKASRDILNIYLHAAVPLDLGLLEANGCDKEAARNALIDHTLANLFRRDPDTRFLEVFFRNGGSETLHWRDLLSGALLMSVVERAKDYAIRRAIESGDEDTGLTPEDMDRAVKTEFKENEIFPKSDTQEDWLKLLDYEPENVVTVRPIRPEEEGRRTKRGVI